MPLASHSYAAGYDSDNASASAYANGWGTSFPQWSLDGTTFVQGSNSGFGAWSLSADPNAAVRIESVASLGGGSALDAGGKSFRLSGGWFDTTGNNNWSRAYAHATRYLDPLGLDVGQALSFKMAVNYRNGAKGVDLFDTLGNKIFNFNVGGDDYVVSSAATGNGTVGVDYSSDSVFTFLFTQTSSTGGTWKITRSGGVTSVTEGTYTGIIRKLDWYAGGTDNNNPDALFFNNLLIGPSSRTVNISVNLNSKISKGVFNPTNHGLELKGAFNSWGTGIPFIGPDTNGVYTASILWPGPTNPNVEFKLYATGTGGLAWENPSAASQYGSTGNRSLALGADGTVTNLPVIYFGDDDGVGPVITRTGPATVNLKVGDPYTDEGASSVDVIEGSCVVTPSVVSAVSLADIPKAAGTYTITYNSWDAAGNQGTPVTRTVVVTALNDGYDAFISGKTTNSQTLVEYAFGATDVGVLAASNRPQVAAAGGNLVLSYNVRVTNPALVVVPQLSTDLSAGFATSGAITVSTNGQITSNGILLEQRTANVPIDSAPRKFLRLQVQRGQ